MLKVERVPGAAHSIKNFLFGIALEIRLAALELVSRSRCCSSEDHAVGDRDRTEPYDLGDEEFHLAFETDDYAGALAKHKAMGCVAFENKEMGIYFIQDPDDYWLEILPTK